MMHHGLPHYAEVVFRGPFQRKAFAFAVSSPGIKCLYSAFRIDEIKRQLRIFPVYASSGFDNITRRRMRHHEPTWHRRL